MNDIYERSGQMVKRLGQTKGPFNCQKGKYDFFPFNEYYDIIIFLRKETRSQVNVVVHGPLGFLFIFLFFFIVYVYIWMFLQ